MGTNSAWADDITSLPASYDYTTQTALDGNVISPFDVGTVKAGTNVKALTISDQTATAYFDSNTNTEGRQAYTIASNEKVSITINAYHGYVGGNKNATISIVNSDGVALASYTWNVTDSKISDVKIGGTTVSDFNAFGFRSYNTSTRDANGLAPNSYPYLANDNNNPVITMTIYGSGDVIMNFARQQGEINETFTGALGGSIKKDLSKITVSDASGNADRSYHIGKLSITSETMSNVTVKTQYMDGDGNKIFEDKENEISFGDSFTPTYNSSASTEFYDYAYASGGDEIASVTSDKVVTILYSKTAKSAYSGYTIHYAQDYDLTATSAVWTTATGGRFTPTILEEDGNRYLSVVQDTRGQNSTTLTSTSTQGKVSSGNNFTCTFDIKLGNSNTDVPSFTIYDASNSEAIFSLTGNAKSTEKWKINNDTENPIELSGTSTNKNITDLTWYSVKVTRSGTNTYVNIKKKSDGTDVFALAQVTTLSETGGIGKMTFGSGRYNGNFALDNVMIRDVVENEDLPATVTLASNEAKHLTFHNAGSGTANDNNWMMNIYNAGSKVSEVRADWWDNVATGNSNFTNAYLWSNDGGITSAGDINWGTFCSDSQDADCDFTVSYTGGTLYVIGTMTKGDDVYYVNYSKGSLTGNVSIYLYGNNATLSNVNTTTTNVNTTWVAPSNAIPATVTTAGWATLYTGYALDFSSVEGLEAYTATLSDNTVTLTKVDNIPANTGVVLKATETLSENKTYNIPVAISSTTDKGSLKGSTTEAKAASEQAPIYILKLNANNEAQFMRATTGSLAAGKAYLELTSQAKALTVVFANDPTGIANVNAAETVQPVKRIVNGQLVIEKNGKRYNAAGAEL